MTKTIRVSRSALALIGTLFVLAVTLTLGSAVHPSSPSAPPQPVVTTLDRWVSEQQAFCDANPWLKTHVPDPSEHLPDCRPLP